MKYKLTRSVWATTNIRYTQVTPICTSTNYKALYALANVLIAEMHSKYDNAEAIKDCIDVKGGYISIDECVKEGADLSGSYYNVSFRYPLDEDFESYVVITYDIKECDDDKSTTYVDTKATYVDIKGKKVDMNDNDFWKLCYIDPVETLFESEIDYLLRFFERRTDEYGRRE